MVSATFAADPRTPARSGPYTRGVSQDHLAPAPGQDRRERRRGRRVLLAALVLLLVPLLALVGYLAYLNKVVGDNVTRRPLLPTGEAAVPTDATGGVLTPSPAAGQTYLVVGSDARSSDTGSRSDVMVLAHVNEAHSAVTLVHFPRDLWVSIPGKGEGKLNAAYAYGGAPLLVQTLQNLVGAPIDHVAVVDFAGFKAMTDAVGGVTVQVAESSNSSGVVFTEGPMHMDGATALTFVRERKGLAQGDIGRGQRQMAFIKALMLKTLSKEVLLNPVTLAGFTDAATSNLVVDEGLDVATMRSEALALRNLRGSDIRFVTAPFTGFGTSPDGQSIDLTDTAGMARLGEALRTDTMDTYSP